MDKPFCPYCMFPVRPGEICPNCGLTAGSYVPSPHHLPPGTILQERYLVGRVLGEGGFGITYIGCDLRLELKIAIKEYYPMDRATRNAAVTLNVTSFMGPSAQSFERGKQKFLGEARAMAKMDKQQVIVSVRDYFEANNTAYIVMEYIEGTTFSELVKQKGGRIPPQELFVMLEPLFGALSMMHENGLIHRDISPDNLMLEHGAVRLLDFGCARETTRGTETLTIALKHGYAPIEQYQQKGQGAWTDIYALCATIYFCLTGKAPPQALDRITVDGLLLPSKLGVDLPPYREAALLKGLRLSPSRRYRSMEELHAALYRKADPAEEETGRELRGDGPAEKDIGRQLLDDGPAEEDVGGALHDDSAMEEDTCWERYDGSPAEDIGEELCGDGLPEGDAVPESGDGPAEESSNGAEEIGLIRLWKDWRLWATAAILIAFLLAVQFSRTGGGEIDGLDDVSDQGPSVTTQIDPFADAVTVTNASEAALRIVLADKSIPAVILAACGETYNIQYEELTLTKPVKLEKGAELHLWTTVTVESGGLLQIDGTVYNEGILRTTGGGAVAVGASGVLEGSTLVWLEHEEDLTMEPGGVAVMNGEHFGQTEGGSHFLVLCEEELFAQAKHVKSLAEYQLALMRSDTTAIVVDGDMTLPSDEVAVSKVPVLISEGVTVSMGSAPREEWGERWPMLFEDTVLINRGTLRADLNMGAWDENGSREDTACALLNYGTISGAVFRDASGAVVNMGEFAVNSAQVLETDFYNLGTLIERGEGDENFLNFFAVTAYNAGELIVEGVDSSYMTITQGAYFYNYGTLTVEAGAQLDNQATLDNCGSVIVAAGGALNNRGYFLDAGTLELDPDSVLYHGGLIQRFHSETLRLPDETVDMGGAILTMDAESGTRQAGTEEELRAALEDESCALVMVTGDLTISGDLTVTKGLQATGGVLSVTGDLTFTGPEAAFWGVAELNGGQMTVADGAAVAANQLAGCGGLTIRDEGLLLCQTELILEPGAAVTLDNSSVLITLQGQVMDHSTLRIGSLCTMRAMDRMEWYGCQAEVENDGALQLNNINVTADKDTAVTIAEDGFVFIGANHSEYWSLMHGSLVNRGQMEIASNIRVPGSLTNYGSLRFYMKLSVSGTVDNQGALLACGENAAVTEGGVLGTPVVYEPA